MMAAFVVVVEAVALTDVRRGGESSDVEVVAESDEEAPNLGAGPRRGMLGELLLAVES